MPNDVTSDITFVGLQIHIDSLVRENLRFSTFFPEVLELKEMDSHVLYPRGYATLLERTNNSATFRVESIRDPPLDVLQAMTDLFPGLYIRCLWRDEGGQEGLWVTTHDGIREMRWVGPCLEAYVMDPFVVKKKEDTNGGSCSNAGN